MNNQFTRFLPFGASQQEPDRIVIHAMAEFIDDGITVQPAFDFLKQYRLSAHSLITPSGVSIRTRRDHQGAFHAKGFNTNSLGIEYLVPGVHDYASFLETMKLPYLTEAAYQKGLEQIKNWINRYPIRHIDAHSQLDPDRKHDPGSGFPMERLLEDIQL